jgi:hypothetical protein
MDAMGSQPGLKSGDMNFASVRLKEQLESSFEGFPFLMRIRDSRGQEYEFGKGAHHWREDPLKIHLKSVKSEKVMVYLSGGSQTLLNGNAHVYRVYCQAK